MDSTSEVESICLDISEKIETLVTTTTTKNHKTLLPYFL